MDDSDGEVVIRTIVVMVIRMIIVMLIVMIIGPVVMTTVIVNLLNVKFDNLAGDGRR